MQIQLKQAEIVAALKQYITKQGIDLSSKLVEIRFTAGRKDGGLLADVTIDDDNFIPGIDDAKPIGDAVLDKPGLAVVTNLQKTEPSAAAASAEPPAALDPIMETPAPETTIPTKSLFG